MAEQSEQGFDENILSKAQNAVGNGPGPASQKFVNELGDSMGAAAVNNGPAVERIIRSIANFPEYQWHYTENICFRQKVNALYKTVLFERSETAPEIDWYGPFGRTRSELQEKANSIKLSVFYVFSAEEVYRKKLKESQEALMVCLAENAVTTVADIPTPPISLLPNPAKIIISPFDRRVDKLSIDSANGTHGLQIGRAHV